MAYDFTADSEAQMTLATELKTHAEDFGTEYGKLYTQIDGLSSTWVGEDYDAFQEGTHGYEKALGDLRNGIDLFSKHFERMSAGTDALATELVDIIKNATEGSGAAGAGSGNSDGSTPSETDTTDPNNIDNPYGGNVICSTDEYGNTVYQYYDEDGNLRQIDKMKDGKLIYQEKKDENNNCTYVMYTNTDGSYVEKEFKDNEMVSYKYYDANGNLEKWNEYADDEQLIRTTEYKYDENNNLVSSTTTNADKTYFVVEMDGENVSSVKQYDANHNLLFENTSDAAAVAAALAGGAKYFVNSNGSYRITSEGNDGKVEADYTVDGYKRFQRTTNADGVVTKTEWYDKSGKVIERYEFNENGDVDTHYKLNENGELTEVTDEDAAPSEENGKGAEDAGDEETSAENDGETDSDDEETDSGDEDNPDEVTDENAETAVTGEEPKPGEESDAAEDEAGVANDVVTGPTAVGGGEINEATVVNEEFNTGAEGSVSETKPNPYAIDTSSGRTANDIYIDARDLSREMEVEIGYLTEYQAELTTGVTTLTLAHANGRISDEDYESLLGLYNEKLELCGQQIEARMQVSAALTEQTNDAFGSADGALKDARDFGSNNVVASREIATQINTQMEEAGLIDVSEISRDPSGNGNAACLSSTFIPQNYGTQGYRLNSLQTDYNHVSELTMRSAYAVASATGQISQSQSCPGAVFFNSYNYVTSVPNYQYNSGSYIVSDASILGTQQNYNGYDSVYYDGRFYTYNEWLSLNLNG